MDDISDLSETSTSTSISSSCKYHAYACIKRSTYVFTIWLLPWLGLICGIITTIYITFANPNIPMNVVIYSYFTTRTTIGGIFIGTTVFIYVSTNILVKTHYIREQDPYAHAYKWIWKDVEDDLVSKKFGFYTSSTHTRRFDSQTFRYYIDTRYIQRYCCAWRHPNDLPQSVIPWQTMAIRFHAYKLMVCGSQIAGLIGIYYVMQGSISTINEILIWSVLCSGLSVSLIYLLIFILYCLGIGTRKLYNTCLYCCSCR